MSIQDFFNTYDKKGINFDGSFGNQCVDLYRQYVKDVLGLPQSPPVKGASWIRTTYDKSLYDWFDNTITAVPQLGDILIWDQRAGGGFGHVAIYKSGNVFAFTSFDQNYPSQGYYDKFGNFIGTGVCHFQGHNYFGGLVGWLRAKKNAPLTNEQKEQKIRQELGVQTSSTNHINNIEKIIHG